MELLSQPKQQEITYGSAVISYSLIVRERKTITIRVRPTGEVEVVAPVSATLLQVAERVRRRAAWIIRQQEALSADRALRSTGPAIHIGGNTLLPWSPVSTKSGRR